MGDSDWIVLTYGAPALGAPYSWRDSGAGPFDTEREAFEFAKHELPDAEYIVVPDNADWDEPEPDPFWDNPVLRAVPEPER
jgi:hypothetical protein